MYKEESFDTLFNITGGEGRTKPPTMCRCMFFFYSQPFLVHKMFMRSALKVQETLFLVYIFPSPHIQIKFFQPLTQILNIFRTRFLNLNWIRMKCFKYMYLGFNKVNIYQDSSIFCTPMQIIWSIYGYFIPSISILELYKKGPVSKVIWNRLIKKPRPV